MVTMSTKYMLVQVKQQLSRFITIYLRLQLLQSEEYSWPTMCCHQPHFFLCQRSYLYLYLVNRANLFYLSYAIISGSPTNWELPDPSATITLFKLSINVHTTSGEPYLLMWDA